MDRAPPFKQGCDRRHFTSVDLAFVNLTFVDLASVDFAGSARWSTTASSEVRPPQPPLGHRLSTTAIGVK